MAAPVYASDLADVITEPTATTGWTALGGGAAGLNAEQDYFVQGSYCLSKNAWAAAAKGQIYNNGSGITVASGDAVWVWMTHHTPAALATETAGGMQLLIGSGTSAYYQWYMRGSDTIEYGAPWVCAIVDPTITADATAGSPTSTLQYFGGIANLPSAGPTKGSPWGIDAIRYGRTFTCTAGASADGYATFAGAVAYNDNNARVYGQIQAGQGTYIARGRFRIGSSGTACDFRDTNRNILFDRLTKVSSTFNEIEIVNASTRVDWTGITVTQLLGSPQTATRVRFLATNNADINIESCNFIDTGTFSFLGNSTINDTIFRRTNLITTGGATFTNCVFTNTNDSVKAVTVSSPANAALISNSEFISSGTKHGLEITGTAANFTLTGVSFSGYAPSNGSTGNEAIYVNIGSGTVVISIAGGGDTPSIRTAGATVTVQNAVTVKVTAKDANTAANIQNARVLLYASTGSTVTISRSGSTASVVHTSHGYTTGQKVMISGAVEGEYNGIQTITVTGANGYDYTVSGSPSTPATGTITSYRVILDGLTDASGIIQDTGFNYTTDLNVTGRVRKSSSAPYYKNSPLSGTITSAGFNSTSFLVGDD